MDTGCLLKKKHVLPGALIGDGALIGYRALIRMFTLFVTGVTSEPQTVLYGVPQRSLFWAPYCSSCISRTCHNSQLYTDDTLIYFGSSSISSIELNLSRNLDRSIQWLVSNFLSLNFTKTKVMLIGTHQRLCTIDSFTI